MIKDFKPGDYELLTLDMTNNSGVILDVKGLFVSLDIYEDIFSATLCAELILEDGVDLIKNFPIVGEEKLHVVYRTREDFNQIDLTFYNFECVELPVNTNGAKIIKLNLVTRERMLDQFTLVQRSFSQPHCACVNNILRTELQTTKTIFTDSCLGKMNYAPAMHKPFEAIMLITSRAQSKETVNPAHVFFESNRGFNFKTIEKLIKSSPTVYNMLPKNYAGQLEEDKFYSVNAFSKIKSISTLEKVNNGSINSTYVKFDPITRTIVTEKKSVFDKEQFAQTEKLGSQNFEDKVYSDNFEFKNEGGLFKLILDSDKGKVSQDRQIILNNYTNSFLVNIDIPGNSNLAVGDIIDFRMLDQIPNGEQESRELAGKYLITALRHHITKRSYHCYIEMNKDTYSSFPSSDITKIKSDI